ncbi:MAG: hypothetical protein K0U41_06340 [Gammaproteobacteria bacterium]|nr:hypothetical protein [Gammaproteobacteria bacterium]
MTTPTKTTKPTAKGPKKARPAKAPKQPAPKKPKTVAKTMTITVDAKDLKQIEAQFKKIGKDIKVLGDNQKNLDSNLQKVTFPVDEDTMRYLSKIKLSAVIPNLLSRNLTNDLAITKLQNHVRVLKWLMATAGLAIFLLICQIITLVTQ